MREIVGEMCLLLPGIGAQGANIGETMEAGSNGEMLMSSSRAIIFADSGNDFGDAARQMAIKTRDEINHCRIMS